MASPPTAVTGPNAKSASGATTGIVVGVVVNALGGYSRGVLRGAATFAAARGWTLKVVGVNDEGGGGQWAGILVQAATEEQASEFAAIRLAGVPVVNISSSLVETGLPTVITDDGAVGRLGADHFLRMGYRSLAFYAPETRAFARARYDGFAKRCGEGRRVGPPPPLLATEGALVAALGSMEKPVGVMGCNDRAALGVLEACRGMGGMEGVGLRVPEDVAVLGVDDDDLVQAIAYPPLSTVNTARDRVGFEAAAMLERMMQGEKGAAEIRTVLVPPKGVVRRRSTDATAIADSDVAEAARFIHANSGRGISVEDVARAATVSRRQLERKFKTAMGRSLLEEIVRCRVDRARQLLIETELTLEQVATASGFASSSYFSVVFKAEAGSTPQRFRDSFRSR